MTRVVLCLLLGICLAACRPQSPLHPAGLQAVTAVPTLDLTDRESLCSAVQNQWGRDWPTTIRALEALLALQAVCDDGLAINLRLYTAYMAHGTLLEQRGHREDAVQAYLSALEYNRLGAEAANRLRDLSVRTPEPPPGCEPGDILAAHSLMTDYSPTSGSYVRIKDQAFILNGQPYPVYGVNYYPRDTPGKRFLTETDVESISFELDILKAAGLNTLRIFVQHDALFTCPGNGAVPVAENFTRLDAFIRAAAARGLKLIVTLNDAPDLNTYPLYHGPQHTVDQMNYVLTRYRNEPAIMAWDLRDGGDLDYSSQVAGESTFSRETVLNWLTQASITARQTAPNHLITAGWRVDSEATIPMVDFVSFQHFDDANQLRQRIANLRAQTTKPILLAAVGYSTFDGLNEIGQRDKLYEAFEAAQHNHLAGWLVWTMFDYPLSVACPESPCPESDSAANHFGLWNTSYFPKQSLQAVKTITGVQD